MYFPSILSNAPGNVHLKSLWKRGLCLEFSEVWVNSRFRKQWFIELQHPCLFVILKEMSESNLTRNWDHSSAPKRTCRRSSKCPLSSLRKRMECQTGGPRALQKEDRNAGFPPSLWLNSHRSLTEKSSKNASLVLPYHTTLPGLNKETSWRAQVAVPNCKGNELN